MDDFLSSEQHRHECECREWLARIRAKKPRNITEGLNMLNELIEQVGKVRGKARAEKLRAGIEAERLKGGQ